LTLLSLGAILGSCVESAQAIPFSRRKGRWRQKERPCWLPTPKGIRVRQGHKTFLVWIMLIFAFVVVWQFLNSQQQADHPLLFSMFVQDVDQHPEKFKSGSAITIKKNAESAEFRGTWANGE